MSARRIRIRIATGGMLVSLLLGFLLGCMYMSEQMGASKDTQLKSGEAVVLQEEDSQEKMDQESFSAGLLLGVDFSTIEELYYSKLITEETYNELLDEFENYSQNPSKENQEKWYKLYIEKVTEISNSPRLPEFWMPTDG